MTPTQIRAYQALGCQLKTYANRQKPTPSAPKLPPWSTNTPPLPAPQPFLPGASAVPPSGKLIGAQELKNMVEASLDGWLTTGRFNAEFEKKLAAFIGIKHLITVNSGSSANLVAFSTLTSPKLGERAIQKAMKSLAWPQASPPPSTPSCSLVPCRCLWTWTASPTTSTPARSKPPSAPRPKPSCWRTALGNPFNLDVVTALCKKYNLWLVEDCCDALGSTYRGQMVGTFGDIATLSFYPAHHITMGEGGAVFTNNDELKTIAESFRDWGRDCYCQPGKDNTCGKRFCQAIGRPALRLRPQVHLQPSGLQPQDHRHAGRLRLGPIGKSTGVHPGPQGQLCLPERTPEGLRRIHVNLPEATEHSDPSWFGFPIT